jgi:2-dehydro-3-deoxy-D-arabinonate dehydratase
VDEQEVWACGVTYQRSRQGREEESVSASLYTAVYEARRPEVFFKSVPSRVVGDGEDVGIRADSGWDVPEPELGLVVNSGGDIVGYVVGNDMSSRSIEGENPLYLPQAKVYERSCALGPGIVPAWEVEGPFDISVQITRGQADVFSAKTSTATMHRDLADLVDWTTRAMEFPQGLVLLTGTGLVPERDVTLQAGDVITIGIDCVGTLTNSVRMVGR